MGTARKPPRGAPVGPYEAERIGRVIEERREELRVSVKELAPKIATDKAGWSRKMKGKTPLFLWEISILCVELKGWYGFPFVGRAEGQALEGLHDRMGELVHYLSTHPRKG